MILKMMWSSCVALEETAAGRVRGYGLRLITTDPFCAGGSHESTPEYEAVSLPVATFEAAPVRVALQ